MNIFFPCGDVIKNIGAWYWIHRVSSAQYVRARSLQQNQKIMQEFFLVLFFTLVSRLMDSKETCFYKKASLSLNLWMTYIGHNPGTSFFNYS